MSEQHPHHRPIRSYVLREGRLTAGQHRAFSDLWPRWGVALSGNDRLDPAEIFGNDRPVWLEIGFGNGESLAALAAAHPELDFLGIEVHRPGVGPLLLKLDELGLSNCRVIRHDAVEALKALPDASVDRVLLFFPDPWHKKRHHKRRIVQPAFVDELARVIRPGGMFHAATDWDEYARHMMSVLSASAAFDNTAGPGRFVPRPEARPETKFERRGQRLGHGVWDLLFARR